MSDHDPDMSPDDMLRSYMGPSARSGPEAARQCLICGKELLSFENVLSKSQTCMNCSRQMAERNAFDEGNRAKKARDAYFAGLDEGAPELQRELAASKNRALQLDEQLATFQQELARSQQELARARLQLKADKERRKWEEKLAGMGFAPVTNRAQLFLALGIGVAVGIMATNAFHKHWKKA